MSSLPFSASVGGGPIQLTATAVPGQVVHENPVNSGGNDVIHPMVVSSTNPNTVTLYKSVSGPEITTPVWQRRDIPATDEGQEPTDIITPIILEPGFSLSMYVEPYDGYVPCFLYGAVDRRAASAFEGYGGLKTAATQTLADLAAGNWATIPFSGGSIITPVNVTQDALNNRLSLNTPGVWSITAYLTLEFARDHTNDRVLFVRIWNETKGVEASSSPFPIYIEQASTGVSWALSAVPVDVDASIVGDFLRLEIGGSAQAFTGIQIDKAGFNAYRLGGPTE